MEPKRGQPAIGTAQAGARRSTAYARAGSPPPAGNRTATGTEKRGNGRGHAARRLAAADGNHRRQMLLARLTQGAQQRSAEKAAIERIPDKDARRAAEAESKSAYENSPESHTPRRQVGKGGLKIEKPTVEKALENSGKMMTGFAKRLQRDIRYTLAPPDKSMMKIGGNNSDIHADRPSAGARPAPVQERSIPKTQAQPEHARW